MTSGKLPYAPKIFLKPPDHSNLMSVFPRGTSLRNSPLKTPDHAGKRFPQGTAGKTLLESDLFGVIPFRDSVLLKISCKVMRLYFCRSTWILLWSKKKLMRGYASIIVTLQENVCLRSFLFFLFLTCCCCFLPHSIFFNYFHRKLLHVF